MTRLLTGRRRLGIDGDIARTVALFRSLADETRLRIVARLAAGEARVVDLTGELGLAQSTVSNHLACLRDRGLVDFRTEGQQSFYALTRPELMDLLQAAEGVPPRPEPPLRCALLTARTPQR